ncbi:conserved hypothetical protein [Lodderomyces elongisporus NRRL YB-4239]|uniref:Uncharacterized protein n=1 Tax=Lodderomyces elongisporus (strain ATCC 11503 / CBS 2605 / JCM 1781 / NBRC 1676 / NRRL YB-4239) TaxID=379508 RepID=A5H2N7_LODEL|nr:conserved hypothetical protein [Lodderomyces elongisporus NRRL YB-4239]
MSSTAASSTAPTSVSLLLEQQVTFQYANECDLEIHCSPFGLSGLYIRLGGTNIMGIGSTMGLITGSTKGLIHYNNSNDFLGKKYKLYIVVEGTSLRIDFTPIMEEKASSSVAEDDDKEEVPTLVFNGPCPEGRPDEIEPFIGIFSFERETE